jgi:hypothetical protein
MGSPKSPYSAKVPTPPAWYNANAVERFYHSLLETSIAGLARPGVIVWYS